MPISFINGEGGDTILSKINGVFGIDSGALISPYNLTFSVFHRLRTLSVNSDITLVLASSGTISNTFETIRVTGDATHALTFPMGTVLKGEDYDNTKVQEITFRYNGNELVATITTIGNIPPSLLSASISNIQIRYIALFFNSAMTITSAGWSVSASGGAVTITSVKNSGNTTPLFYLSRDIATGETVTISYNPATGSTTNASGVEISTITNQAVTNNVTSTPVLFYDDFSDATTDSDLWTTTNPADGVAIANTSGRIRFTGTPASPVTSSNTNHVDSNPSFSSSIRVFRASIFKNAQSVNQGAFFKAYNASDTYSTARSVFFAKNSSGKITLSIYNGSTFPYAYTSTIDWNGAIVKMVKDGSNLWKFYYYSGGWVELDAAATGGTKTYDIGGAVKVSLGSNSSASDTGSPNTEFDLVYVNNADYSTSVPV